MTNLAHVNQVAVELISERLSFDWKDFSVESNLYESKVPKIRFSGDDICVMVDEVDFYRKAKFDKYVRECQVKFKECTFIFKLTATYHSDCTEDFFSLGIYTPAGDGVGGIVPILAKHRL